jgi:hypothetical protein
MWTWIICNSAGIGAIAAVVAAIFAILGFAVLCIYAFDTKTIARAASYQTKDNLLPFVSLDLTTDADGLSAVDPRSWKLENQGSGPALNLKIWLLNDQKPKQRFSMMKGSVRKLLDAHGQDNETFHARMRRPEGVRAEYMSLAGERLRSTFRLTESDGIEVTFENLSRHE